MKSERHVTALGRARARAGAPGIFASLRVSLCGPFDKIDAEDLASLVRLGGGTILPIHAPELDSDAGLVRLVARAKVSQATLAAEGRPAPPGPLLDQAWLLDSISAFALLAVSAQYRVEPPQKAVVG